MVASGPVDGASILLILLLRVAFVTEKEVHKLETLGTPLQMTV
jgi:hypothetical protein